MLFKAPRSPHPSHSLLARHYFASYSHFLPRISLNTCTDSVAPPYDHQRQLCSPSTTSRRVLLQTPPRLCSFLRAWPDPRSEAFVSLFQPSGFYQERDFATSLSQFKDRLLPRRAVTPSFRTWLASSYLHQRSCGHRVSQICWQIQPKTQPKKNKV